MVDGGEETSAGPAYPPAAEAAERVEMREKNSKNKFSGSKRHPGVASNYQGRRQSGRHTTTLSK